MRPTQSRLPNAATLLAAFFHEQRQAAGEHLRMSVGRFRIALITLRLQFALALLLIAATGTFGWFLWRNVGAPIWVVIIATLLIAAISESLVRALNDLLAPNRFVMLRVIEALRGDSNSVIELASPVHYDEELVRLIERIGRADVANAIRASHEKSTTPVRPPQIGAGP